MEAVIAYVVGGVSLLFVIFFSLADGALSEFSWRKLEERLAEGERSRFQRNERAIAISARIISLVSSVAFGFAALFTTLRAFPEQGALSYALAGGAVVAAMILCSMVPDLLGRRTPESVILFLLPVLTLMEKPARPFTRLIISVAELLARVLGFPSDDSGVEHIEEEIKSAIAEGKHEGLFAGGEDKMLRNIMEFQEVQISEIMTPRTDMFALDAQTSVSEAVALAHSEGHSRIPVFGENLDDVTGVLYVKDLLAFWESREQSPRHVGELIRKPYFVPETKAVGDLLLEMKRDKVHLAVVMDEYGGTAGIITIEDIIEEIVGEIEDEYDKESPPPYESIDASTANVDARFHVDELNESLGLAIPEDDSYETVSGFLFAQIGRIPEQGEVVTFENITFTILEADERSLKRVQVHRSEGPRE